MKRRTFLKRTGATAVAAGTVLAGAPAVHTRPKYAWKMATWWPKEPDAGASYFAQTIETLSDKRITIKVYAAGELMPPEETFDAVAQGTIELHHASAFFWQAKHPATVFFSGIPFGLNSQEMNAWVQFGGGQELWDELYARFNLKPFPCGNVGVSMGGWFNTEIHTIADFQGLKMRIPGLGGEVLKRFGVEPFNVPHGDILAAFQAGTIDAAEVATPYIDLAMELYKAAKFYYWPGWQEPSAVPECAINKQVYDALPADLQAIVTHAARSTMSYTHAENTAKNAQALVELIRTHKVQMRRFSDKVLAQLGKASREVVAEIGAHDAFSRKVYASYTAFQEQAVGWSQVGEEGYSLARTLVFLQ